MLCRGKRNAFVASSPTVFFHVDSTKVLLRVPHWGPSSRYRGDSTTACWSLLKEAHLGQALFLHVVAGRTSLVGPLGACEEQSL